MVNEKLASEIWLGEDALGKCVKIVRPTEPCTEIVGIVGAARTEELFEEASGQYYLAFGSTATRRNHERAADQNPREACRHGRDRAPGVTDALSQLAVHRCAAAAIFHRSANRGRRQLGATMFAVFGELAFAIAIIGLYSVTSYVTPQRTHEIGVRIALGAQTRDVSRLFIAQGMKLVTAGTFLGCLTALAISRVVSSLLYGVSATDKLTFIGNADFVMRGSALACYIPARRREWIR
ncbi:MAG: FtsX-like permease family protein [Pyrinomonadaceae bacterium]